MSLEQEDVRDAFVTASSDGWTEVYFSSYASRDHNFGIYCALLDPSMRADSLAKDSWDLGVTDGAPGFTTYYDQGKDRTLYERFNDRDGVEPLVLVRESHGVRPGTVEISEEFRLYHNFYWDAPSNTFVTFSDAAETISVIEMGVDRVRIRAKHLRQFQAAKQMDLALFIDSVRWGAKGETAPDNVDWSGENLKLARWSGDSSFTDLPFTRVLGKRILPAPPIEKSGKWPYEDTPERHPEFIIGVDEDGEEIRYSSDHEALANYFGANPDAPHYLTPVHFRKEVLRKYYDNPDLYTVEDGYVRCAGLWGVQIDNDHDDRVVVFLGDLGRDLPEGERDYWFSFNIAPDRRMSETGLRRSFLAQFAAPESADLSFRSSYMRFTTNWPETMGWRLFREPVGSDAQLLQQIRTPLNESDAEFDETIGRLAKLMCDLLNDADLDAQLADKIANEKSIGKIGRWMESVGYTHRERDIKYLRDLQELRSTVSAHSKGLKFEQRLAKILGDKRGRAAIVELLQRGSMMLDDLLEFATHQ